MSVGSRFNVNYLRCLSRVSASFTIPSGKCPSLSFPIQRMPPIRLWPTILLLYCFMLLYHITCSASQLVCASPHGTARPQLWSHLHPSALAETTLSVFPVGSIENHGPHLPFGTDLLLAEAITRNAVQGIDGVSVLPATPFGASFEHANLPGTIPIQDDTLNAFWGDVIAGLVASGSKKIIIVNAHGGQTQNVEVAIRHARFRHNSFVVSFNAQRMLALAWRRVETQKEKYHEEMPYGIHGGFVETAVMMHLFPDLVKTSERKNFRRRREFKGVLRPHGDIVSFGWRSEDISTSGALGDAANASADIGGKIFDETVRELRALVSELVDTDPSDVLHFSGAH